MKEFAEACNTVEVAVVLCLNEEYVGIVVTMLSRNLEKRTTSVTTYEQDCVACCFVGYAVVLNTLCTVKWPLSRVLALSSEVTVSRDQRTTPTLLRISQRTPGGLMVAAD